MTRFRGRTTFSTPLPRSRREMSLFAQHRKGIEEFRMLRSLVCPLLSHLEDETISNVRF